MKPPRELAVEFILAEVRRREHGRRLAQGPARVYVEGGSGKNAGKQTISGVTFPGWMASYRDLDVYLKANDWAPDGGAWRLTTGPRVIIATHLEALKIQQRKDAAKKRKAPDSWQCPGCLRYSGHEPGCSQVDDCAPTPTAVPVGDEALFWHVGKAAHIAWIETPDDARDLQRRMGEAAVAAMRAPTPTRAVPVRAGRDSLPCPATNQTAEAAENESIEGLRRERDFQRDCYLEASTERYRYREALNKIRHDAESLAEARSIADAARFPSAAPVRALAGDTCGEIASGPDEPLELCLAPATHHAPCCGGSCADHRCRHARPYEPAPTTSQTVTDGARKP